MSQENVETARRFYIVWNNDDREPALAFFADDVVWTPAREDPDPAPHRGREGVRTFWAQWEELFDNIRIDAEELIEVGDRVVSRLHVTGSGKGSGIHVDQRVYQVVDFRNGSIWRVEEFYDRAEALEAAGLSE
jgi:ketosteroid isomerase-like protein